MITVKEIARLAGVSAKTAERALSGVTKDIRRDARERAERVRKIAEAHGYQPSEIALSLRRGRNQTIGVMIDILTDQFLAAAVETMMDEAAKYQYRIALQVVRFDKEQTHEAIKQLLSSGVEGVITSCGLSRLPREFIHTLEKRKYPLFTLCGRSGHDFSSSAPDYSQALPQAVETLVKKGHKRITLCLFDGKEKDNAQNGKIFAESCKKFGAEPDFRINHDLTQAAELADQHLEAVILYGKYSMRIYLDRCAELNIRPDVIGFYNEWTVASALNFPLCGIILEQAETVVRSAVRQVLAQIKGAEISHIAPLARFISTEEFGSLQLPNLTNQQLFDYQ
ncbi:MAG: LacI family transcriptional regulator [Lentisphaerae bacterium]|nr:LacI family transcriptional regulator [Lentisphaerota bacterium]